MSIQVTVPSPQQRAHDLAIAYVSTAAPTATPRARGKIEFCEEAYFDAYKRYLDLFLKQDSTEPQNN